MSALAAEFQHVIRSIEDTILNVDRLMHAFKPAELHRPLSDAIVALENARGFVMDADMVADKEWVKPEE